MVGPRTFPKHIAGSRGFTLVEIIVVLVIMAIVATAVYTLFAQQQKTYTTQDMVVEMQQNVRAAMDMMTRELRMAGYDPGFNRPARAGIVDAKNQYIRFTCDLNGNGKTTGPSPDDPDENITYALEVATGKLRRGTGTGTPPVFDTILENVLEFNLDYLVIADGSFRGITGTPNEPGGLQRIIWAGIPAPVEKEICQSVLCNTQCDNCKLGIRVVRIHLVVRTPYPDPNSPTQNRPTFRFDTDVAMRNLSYIQ